MAPRRQSWPWGPPCKRLNLMSRRRVRLGVVVVVVVVVIVVVIIVIVIVILVAGRPLDGRGAVLGGDAHRRGRHVGRQHGRGRHGGGEGGSHGRNGQQQERHAGLHLGCGRVVDGSARVVV